MVKEGSCGLVVFVKYGCMQDWNENNYVLLLYIYISVAYCCGMVPDCRQIALETESFHAQQGEDLLGCGRLLSACKLLQLAFFRTVI
jgi:hypothetical protein